MKKFVFILLSMFLSLSLNSCNESSEPKKDSNLAKKLGGPAIYPHSESFVKGQHGNTYYQDGGSCKSCHGSDLSGGTSKISCNSCHSNFPHPQGWSQPSLHAKTFLLGESAQKSQCLNCHQRTESSSSGSGLSRAMSCNTCHSGFPHSADYRNQHKDHAKENTGACIQCHTSVLKTQPSLKEKISCNTCHGESFPHPSGWARPGAHGDHYTKLDETQKTSCLNCHIKKEEDAGLKLTKSPIDLATTPSCKECHTAYPHPPKFDKPRNHAPIAQLYDGKCTLCHTDYKKHIETDKYDQVGCLFCHEGEGDTRVKWFKEPAPQKNKTEK